MMFVGRVVAGGVGRLNRSAMMSGIGICLTRAKSTGEIRLTKHFVDLRLIGCGGLFITLEAQATIILELAHRTMKRRMSN